jgi:ankyrin repeat protein
MKAIRSFFQRKKHFPLLRQAAILLFCLIAFTFPLFADEQEDLTDALREAIPEYSFDKMDIEEINRLLDAGADPNGFYDKKDKKTFLTHAARHSNVPLVKILLEHGADPNFSKTDHAVSYGNSEITALFISHGARFDIVYSDEWSPLLFQTRNDNSAALLILEWEQQHSPDFCANYETRKDYLTSVLGYLLDYSYYRGDAYTLTERLLDAGADPAAPYKTYYNYSYVSVTVAYLVISPYSDGQFIAPLLIERGAPVDAYNQYGQTALYSAIAKNNLALAELLLKKGADINQKGKGKEKEQEDQTALMVATSEEAVKLLLEHDADPNAQDNKGETALMKHRRVEKPLVNLLLKHGADPAIKDNNGRTVLFHWWLSYVDGPMIDELISHGYRIDEPDNEGDTPLIYAAVRGRETALLLLEKGADPNRRNNRGRTALHACLLEIEKGVQRHDDNDMKRDMPVITALLEAGTRPADKDDDGDSALTTALRIVRKNKDKAVISELVQRYADAEEIKITAVTASKMISAEKKENSIRVLNENIPPTLMYLSIPVAWGGVSYLMRNVVFKDNPSDNIMGPINAILTFGVAGAALGVTLGAGSVHPLFGALFGLCVGGVAGILLARLPSVSKAFNDNPGLYYTPTAVSALTVSVVILQIWVYNK